MTPTMLLNGNMLIPKRAEGRGVIGDGFVEVSPNDPEFKKWEAYYKRIGEKIPKRGEAKNEE